MVVYTCSHASACPGLELCRDLARRGYVLYQHTQDVIAVLDPQALS